MVSSSVSAKKSVGWLFGGVRSDGFSNPELFLLVVVESIHFVTSCRGGSAGTDSNRVSSCCESWLVSIIGLINSLLASSTSERSVASCSVVVAATRHASIEARCACTAPPGVPKVLSG